MADFKYRFRIETPMNEDGQVLILTRYSELDGETPTCELLTEDGWYTFNSGDILPIHNVPKISGIDMLESFKVKRILAEYGARVNALLGGFEA